MHTADLEAEGAFRRSSLYPAVARAIEEMLEGCPSAKPQQISLQDELYLH